MKSSKMKEKSGSIPKNLWEKKPLSYMRYYIRKTLWEVLKLHLKINISKKRDNFQQNFGKQQNETFKDLFPHIAISDIGKEYELDNILHREYQTRYDVWSKKMPIIEYDDIRPHLLKRGHGVRKGSNGPTFYFGMSGGTSSFGNNKTSAGNGDPDSLEYKLNQKKIIYIPPEVFKNNQLCNQIIQWMNLKHNPTSNRLLNNVFVFAGYIRVDHQYNPELMHIKAADISALMLQQQNKTINSLFYAFSVDAMTAKEKDRDHFLEEFPRRNIKTIMGVTDKCVTFLEDLIAYWDKKGEKEYIMKQLEGLLVVWGGMDIDIYRKRFQTLGIKGLELMGIHNAAEGMIGVQDLGLEKEDKGVWYAFLPSGLHEFAPRSSFDSDGKYIPGSKVYAPWEITPELLEQQDEFIHIYTAPGQVRSKIDRLRLKFFDIDGRSQLRYQVAGRVNGFINLAGEEVEESHLKKAVSKINEQYNHIITSYHVGPGLESTPPHHEWIIEVNETADLDRSNLAKDIDLFMKKTTGGDYEERMSNDTLGPLQITFVKKGTFSKFINIYKEGQAQDKIPVVLKERTYLDKFHKLMKENLDLLVYSTYES